MSDFFTLSVLVATIASGIRLAMPYLLAALGETIGQRSGVLNLGVDGVMLLSSFGAYYTVLETGSHLAGVGVGLLVGLVMGTIYAIVTVFLHAEQGISGIGIFLFGLGFSDLLFQELVGTPKPVKPLPKFEIPGLSSIPHVGDALFSHNWLYLFEEADERTHTAAILFSGSAQGAAHEAKAELAEHYDVGAELWSATSYKRLREDALATERDNRLRSDGPVALPGVTTKLASVDGPIVAVTDYMKSVPDQIARWVPGPYVSLGTDGFGRSDTRTELRSFFEVNAAHIVVATLSVLADEGHIDRSLVADALVRYEVDPKAPNPALEH